MSHILTCSHTHTHTRIHLAGMAQSMMQASSSVSNIVAPIVTGLILPRVENLYAMLFGCWGLLVVLVRCKRAVFCVGWCVFVDTMALSFA